MNLKVLFVVLYSITISVIARPSFVIDYENDMFLKDGKPFHYASAGIHYFRVHYKQWYDRLYKIKKVGANAIQTYIAWNVHEPKPGSYQFTDQHDIVKFIQLAQQLNLLVILRPGPYICAEWEYGGFPYWVMKNHSKTIRTNDPSYMKDVDKWFSVLLPKLVPLLYTNGGPIISVQVENEYGSYGCDHNYMNSMGDLYRKYLGENVVYFTTDGAGDGYLKCGAVKNIYTTIDFGPGGDVSQTFKIQRKWQPHGPLVNSEYYTGWLDHWGEKHHRTSADLVANYIDKILALNASLNMYMFEGGTNFHFYNGANEGRTYAAQPTSYDYDAPLNEAGDPTQKYFAIQNVLSKYFPIPPGPQPTPSEKAAYGKLMAEKVVCMHELLSQMPAVTSLTPLSFEELDFAYGYVWYSRTIHFNGGVLKLTKFHDRAIVIVDQIVVGVLDRNYNNSLEIPSGSKLVIFVENQGRVNYGPYLTDTAKGILGNVTLNSDVLLHWEMYHFGDHPIESLLQSFENNSVMTSTTSHPVFVQISFDISELPKDTFLKLTQWRKGYVVLNDVNIGRYWTPMGPQQTLYVPKEYLKTGQNTVIIAEFEKDYDAGMYIEFIDHPILGPSESVRGQNRQSSFYT